MPNERVAPVCVAEHDSFGRGSVMVWEGMSAQWKTDLHNIENGTLTAVRCVNEILDVYVRPYDGAVVNDFTLMDDNARAHRARITHQYLEQVTILRMDWPARSPDPNPITCLVHAKNMPGTCYIQQFHHASPTRNWPGAQTSPRRRMGLDPATQHQEAYQRRAKTMSGCYQCTGGTLHTIKVAIFFNL